MLKITPNGTVDTVLVFNEKGLPFRLIQRYSEVEIFIGMSNKLLKEMFTEDELMSVVKGTSLRKTLKYTDLCNLIIQNSDVTEE